jgi:2'-5' RNA ligase
MRNNETDISVPAHDPLPGQSAVWSFALVPPEPLARVFAEQRARFDPAHAATIPHITMKLAFVIGVGALATHNDLVGWLERECRRQRPFEVQLGEVGVFSSCSGYGHVVYIAVNLTPALAELHARLVQGLADVGAWTSGASVEREMVMFFPHLTLAQGVSAATARKILNVARREHMPATFVADRLVLGRSDDGVAWRLVADVRFGGAGSSTPSLLEIEPSGICHGVGGDDDWHV